jgi:hypothetical protein
MELSIGDPLYIDIQARGSEKLLGIITSFSSVGSNLVVKYIPDRAIGTPLATNYPANSVVYYLKADRLNGKTVSNVPQAQIDLAKVAMSYNISNVELICTQLQPSPAYVSAITKNAGSAKGINLDMPIWSLYKSNEPAQNGIIDLAINCNQSRCLSTISVSMAAEDQDNILADSLVGVLDGATEYSWNYDGQLFPNRPLKLTQFLNGRNDPFASSQLVQAVENAGYPFRNMVDLKDRWMFCKSWTKEAQIKDLSQASLSLRIEYNGAQKQKLYNHYVKSLMRVVISSSGVQTFS